MEMVARRAYIFLITESLTKGPGHVYVDVYDAMILITESLIKGPGHVIYVIYRMIMQL